MYLLPMINIPVSTSELNLPLGNRKGSMYKLPNIQKPITPCASSTKQRNSMGKDNHKLLDIVIHSSYRTPPHSVPIACRWLKVRTGVKLFMSNHVHSSVNQTLPQRLLEFLPPPNCQSRVEADVRITIIWKEEIGRDPECFISSLPNTKVKGEVNFLRYLHRQFGLLTGSIHHGISSHEAKIDELIDRIHSGIIWRSLAKEPVGHKCNFQLVLDDIEEILTEHAFLQQTKEPGLVDLLAYVSIKDAISTKVQTNTIQRYLGSCKNYFEVTHCDLNKPLSMQCINSNKLANDVTYLCITATYDMPTSCTTLGNMEKLATRCQQIKELEFRYVGINAPHDIVWILRNHSEYIRNGKNCFIDPIKNITQHCKELTHLIFSMEFNSNLFFFLAASGKQLFGNWQTIETIEFLTDKKEITYKRADFEKKK